MPYRDWMVIKIPTATSAVRPIENKILRNSERITAPAGEW
jgi:hypothetical protein